MRPTDYRNLLFNPYHISDLLEYFISGAQKHRSRGIKFELIYLVIPILHDEKILNKLKSLSIKSRFRSVLVNDEINLLFHAELNPRIKDFRATTNRGLIVLGNQRDLQIGSHVKLSKPIHFNDTNNQQLKQLYKASYQLGLILAKESHITVFSRLHILEI